MGNVTFTIVIIMAVLLGSTVSAQSSNQAPSSQTVAPFKLQSADGTIIAFESDKIKKLAVVCFLGTECPLAQLYGPRLSAMAQQFASDGVNFIGVNSNQQDSLQDIKDYVDKLDVKFAIVKDYDNVVANLFDAQRTPEVFVVDSDMTIRYRGRIDDQFSPGTTRAEPREQYLRDAIKSLLLGNQPPVPATEAVGCLIGRVKNPVVDPKVTYTNQVARVFQRHCVECHRPGEIGPFSLTDFSEAKGWAEMIVEVVDQGRMPPWHATDDHAEFVNARHMSRKDKQILRDWLADGAAYGKAEELPQQRHFTEGWRLPREPDAVFEMRSKPFIVPPDGTVEYQYFVVDPGFEQDKWVTAAEVIPGNRQVVHHTIVFVRPPDGAQFRGVGWLAAYVPGQSMPAYDPTAARLIPAGSKLVFQQHYTPVGSEQSDITKIGLLFGDPQKVTNEIYTRVGIDQQFEIGPGDSDYKVKSSLSFSSQRGKLLGFAPHMHYRGKSFELYQVRDGQRNQLIDVPQYDFNWQHNYQLKQPIPLSEMDRLEFTMTFDNSDANPFNPDPNQVVRWGDQTWEEMVVAFFEISEPRVQESQVANSHQRVLSKEEIAARDAKAAKYADEFFKRFDKNGNGFVERGETPHAIRRNSFSMSDANGDGRLSRDEMLNYASTRF